jgi:hypothetical protein
MKKVIFVTLALALAATTAFAQEIKAYGSARLGYWYEMPNEDYAGGESDFDLNYGIQSNSRFGVNFKKDDLTAKVEYGTGVNLRLLWAKMNMGSFDLLIGQDYDGLNEYAAQVYSADNGLIGYGAVDGSRNPQVKFLFENGLYFALIQPKLTSPNNFSWSETDVLIPKLNVGYKMKMDNLSIHPTFMLQQFSYSKDDNPTLGDDASVLSYLLAVTGQIDMDPMMLKAHLNFGSNTGNMGIKGHSNIASWDIAKNEVNSTSSLGFFLEGAYKMSDAMTLDAGLGYASSSNDAWDESDGRMGLYVQAKMKISHLQLIPEFGIINEMEDASGNKEGSMPYFGTQLRVDF